MSDNPLAALQPDAGGAPPAPVVPDVPAAPIVPDAPADNTPQPSAEEKADVDEWNSVTDEMFPGLKKPEEDKKPDEPTKPEQKPASPEAPKDGETPEQLPDPNDKGADKDGAGKKPGDGQTGEEDEPTAPTDAAARLTAREQQAQIEAVKTDVREKMFKEVATELRDKDGDPIKSLDDVMRLINPRTGQAFTEEEAGMWLLQAQSQLKENVAQIEKQIEQITDTNLDLKDQADVVNFQYGELLRAMPELRASLWAQYEKTLSKDARSGIITKAPVSLQQFYETALEPYAHLGRQLEAQEAAKVTPPTPPTSAPDVAKQQAEAQRQQRRQDRSDIYGPGKVDTTTEEDKEWGIAAQAVFGDQLKK